MKISYNWLAQYIPLSQSPEELGDLLTSIGLEVEGLETFQSIKGGLEGLVVGEVMEKWQHPNADKLSCTKVDVGAEELLPIVCGAPNVEAGQKVVVATVGTTLYGEGDESFQIKKAKIRGEVSQGMICAEDEIGIGTSHDGIMVLPADTVVGTPAADLFDIEIDHVYEIGLTPNRADAACHYGVARDLKAAFAHRYDTKAELCKPSVDDVKPSNNDRTIPVEVQNEEACQRYVGLTISGVKVAESPAWLVNRLNAIGVRPINNIVDITNYVNHAFGQPLHAFDADQVTGDKVVVGTLKEGTKFTSLDGEERILSAQDLMICNAEEGMCIAGVFGGEKSGVTDGTTSIFLESAYFNPVWVRKTAKRHALNTDASFRFERGIDPNITLYAAKYAAKLITEIAGGEISSDISDTHPEAFADFDVTYRFEKSNQFMGADIPRNVVKAILENLEIEVSNSEEEEWKLSVPPFKVDVTREADVVEEVLRIYGYDEVPVTTQIKSSINDIKPSAEARAKKEVTKMLVGNGYLECMTNSMTDARFPTYSTAWSESDIVRLNNPLSSELGIMRPTMLFAGLQNAAFNLNRQQSNLRLFEFGNVYFNADKGFHEQENLGIIVSGQAVSGSWRTNDIDADWYEVKASFDMICARLGIDRLRFQTEECAFDFVEYGINWKFNDKTIAVGGKVNSDLAAKFDIKKDVYFVEVSWSDLVAMRQKEISVGSLPKFPGVKRDLALLVDKQVEYARLEQLAYQTERKLLKSVQLFDVYEGKGLPAGKKSYALSFTLRDENKTMRDKDVDKTMNRLLERFKREAGAELRG